MAERNTDIEMDMVLFHSEREDGYVRFLADSFDEGFEPCPYSVVENLPAVLGYPDEVVAAVESGMGSLAVFHVEFGSGWFTLYLTA